MCIVNTPMSYNKKYINENINKNTELFHTYQKNLFHLRNEVSIIIPIKSCNNVFPQLLL